MGPDSWRRIETLLHEALSRPAQERGAFLDEACGDDAALRSELESLIEADEAAGSFLALPILEESTVADQRIGPYRLVRKLGEGGMSVVYMAQRDDEEYERLVALKLIRVGMDSEDQLRRFRVERQVLAQLVHPNIARLYDGGTTGEGLPYFAMELVEGEPIDVYCDRLRLGVRSRLELFIQVCSAVRAAHQNLVVHRDIKPSNILVTAEGVPKLLDFGIAKLLDPRWDSAGHEATVKWLRVMTPSYASPEQVRGEAITTASDVYSLGVLLYGLLTGDLPHRFEDRTPSQVERQLAEEEPTRASVAVADKAVAAARRGVSTGELVRQLVGDLDNVVAKALHKDPAQRYGSAEQLAEDLRRHLAGLTVTAHPDSFGYRARKFLRRHRAPVAVTAAFVAVVVCAAVLLALQSTRIARERDLAQQERDKARQIAAFTQDVFTFSDPFAVPGSGPPPGETLLARDVLEHAAERIARELEDQPEIQAALRNTIGSVYASLALYDEARKHLNAALAARRELHGREHPSVAESLHQLAMVIHDQGEYQAAEPLLREALRIRRTTLGEEHQDCAMSLRGLAVARHSQGDYESSETLYRQALELQRRLLAPDHDELVTTLNGLAILLHDRGDLDDAEALYRETLDLRRKSLGEEHPLVAESYNNLGILIGQQGRFDQSEPLLRRALSLYRKALGEKHPEVARILANLGSLLSEQGRYADAEAAYSKALDLHREILGEQHPMVAMDVSNLAVLMREKGELERAEALYREALSLLLASLGEEHAHTAFVRSFLAEVLLAQGDYAEAEVLFEKVLSVQRRLLGPEHPQIAWTLQKLAELHRKKGDRAGAEALFREALAMQRAVLDGDHVEMAKSLMELGALLSESEHGDPSCAELLQEALEINRRLLPEDHWLTAHAASLLGECLVRLRRFETAEKLLVESYRVLKAETREQGRLGFEAFDRLVALYQAWGKPEKAAAVEPMNIKK